MAASVPGAILDLWNSIPAAAFGGSTRPPLFLNSAPQTKSDATQRRIPYGVLWDDGINPTFDSSFGGTEGGTVRLELYAFKLEASAGEVSAASMALGAKYGGQVPSAKAGLDWGTLPTLTYRYGISLKRLREQYFEAGKGRDAAGEWHVIHKAVLEYRVVVGLRAGG